MEPPVAPIEGAPIEPVAPEEPWQPSREEFEDLVAWRNEVMTAQQQYEAELAQQQEQQQQGAAIEWLDPESQAQLDRYFEQKLEQKIAPIQQYQLERTQAEGYEHALDVIADIASREGEFLSEKSKDVAFRLARDQFYPEAVQRFGVTPRANEYALEQGVKLVRALEKEAGASYYEREINQLRGLANAPREPGAAGTGAAQQHLVGGLGNVSNAVTNRFFRQP